VPFSAQVNSDKKRDGKKSQRRAAVGTTGVTMEGRDRDRDRDSGQRKAQSPR
jgi:hypothetical protein